MTTTTSPTASPSTTTCSTRTIVPAGAFDLRASAAMLGGFEPTLDQHASLDRGGARVRLAFRLDGTHEPAAVELTQPGPDRPVRVHVGAGPDPAVASAQAARILSLDADATGFPPADPILAGALRPLAGLRPVLFTSAYECAAWGVLSQRISMRQAATLKARLVTEAGGVADFDAMPVPVFPGPGQLADLSVDWLPSVKVDRLRAVGRAALDGQLDARVLRALPTRQAQEQLRRIHGIGPFWAAAIHLRACGIVDEWPDEPICRAALGHLYGLGDQPSPAEVTALTDRFRPWRMWTAVLLRVAASRGLIPGVAGREGVIRRAGSSR